MFTTEFLTYTQPRGHIIRLGTAAVSWKSNFELNAQVLQEQSGTLPGAPSPPPQQVAWVKDRALAKVLATGLQWVLHGKERNGEKPTQELLGECVCV